jgi:hypothetical protein
MDVEEERQHLDDVLSVSLDDGFLLRLGARCVNVVDPLGPAPFAVAVPLENEAESLAAELRILTHDESLHAALTALIQRFGKA